MTANALPLLVSLALLPLVAGCTDDEGRVETVYDDYEDYRYNPGVDDIGPEWVGDWLHFWTPGGAFRVRPSGGEAEKTGPYDGVGVADITTDGEYVYWPYQQSVIKYSDATASFEELPMRYSTVRSLRIAASSNAIYIAYASCESMLALDKNGVELWERQLPEYERQGSGADVAADSSYAYCARGGKVFRVRADGTAHEVIAQGGKSINALALSDSAVYYAEGSFQSGELPSAIYEWSNGVTRLLYQAERSHYITSMVFDERRQRLYWDMGGEAWTLSLATTKMTLFHDADPYPIRYLTQDERHIYWVEGTRIRRKPK